MSFGQPVIPRICPLASTALLHKQMNRECGLLSVVWFLIHVQEPFSDTILHQTQDNHKKWISHNSRNIHNTLSKYLVLPRTSFQRLSWKINLH